MTTIDDLQNLIDERYEQIQRLLELTTQQEAAIENAHMNELMRILAEKQRMIEDFVRASQKLQADRDSFSSPPDVAESYRAKHETTQTLHEELLHREAECQSRLESSRDQVAEELGRGQGARRAAAGYAKPRRQERPSGGGLDLSNDA